VEWTKGSCCKPFAIPMVWREPTDHVSYCYFCLTSITGVTAKSKHTVQYPNLPSAMRSVPHSAELPVPKPPTNMMLSDSEPSDEDVGQANNNMDCDPTFVGASSSNEPHLLTQRDLNDIVHNLNGMEMNVEKTKVMRISRRPFPVKIMIDQKTQRMWNLLNIWVAF